jgi:signal transduction histidine kinase/molybdopterin-guanine dinucleotide biosynthesis protein A
MMYKESFHKLEIKFVLLAAVVILIASTVANYLILNATEDRILSEARQRAQLLVEATAISFTNTLIYEEVGLVEEGGLMENHIAGLLKNENTAIKDVVVLNKDGHTIAANDYSWYHLSQDDPEVLQAIRARELIMAPDRRANARELDVIAPLQIGSKRFGTLIVHFSLAREHRYLATFRNRLLLLTFAGMLVSIFLAALIAKTLARPIKRLAGEMSKVSETNLKSDLVSRRHDEIGQLEQGFLKMLERLRQAAVEKEKSQQALIQAEKLAALGTLVAGVAHEINNPLAGLYSCLRRIEARPEDAAQTKKYGALMRKALSHIENTVQTLLNFARKKAGTYRPVELNAVIENAIELLQYRLQKSGIVTGKHLAPGLPMVLGDESALQQVFVNLLMNAIDAMPKGGTLTINTASGNGEVMAEIIDTGSGIPEAELNKIFDPFYTTKEVGKGTGLGLAIVRRIVTDHNGAIDVHSKAGHGSTFRLRFSAINAPPESRKARVCAAILAGGKSSRMGTNKALLQLNGKSVIEHVAAAVRKVADEVMLITNTPEKYGFLSLPMFRDEIQGIGPLGGIYTALQKCTTTHCLIVACDLPFLSEPLLRFLSENAGDAEIFAIDSGNGVEPLCAVYSKSCLPEIERQMAQKQYKVADLLAKVRARIVRFDASYSFYSPHLFYNVNTPEEWRQAGEMMAESS